MAQYQPPRLPMLSKDLDSLRQLCRDHAAFQQLQQFLEEREILYQQFSTQIAQQMQKNQELEDQQRVAEAASQAKSHFLAMMSHELRTPLNSILGLSTLLSQQVPGELNAKQLEYLACIHESGEHLLALISDILDLSKVEAGQEKLRLTEISVVALCQSCVAMVQSRATTKGLVVSYTVADGAEVCWADERRLRQMLLNLLSNAVKFTDEGQVTLTVQRQGTLIQFEVEDTGIGIPVEKRGQLFRPFTQLDGDLNRRYEGTGLGLALTQQLAQLHGGYLTVESEGNRGSRFLLYLPIVAYPDHVSKADLASPSTRPADSATTESLVRPPLSQEASQDIVLVHGDRERYEPLITYVQTCGWRIYPLRSWNEAQIYLGQHPPRLLMVGAEAPLPALAQHLQHLRGSPTTQNVKVVVIQDPQQPMAQEGVEADAYLDLPLTIPKVERILSL